MNVLLSRRRILRILRGIETDLAGSDPPMAGLFAMFTSLTRGEELPAAEKLKAGPVRMLAWLTRADGLGRLFIRWHTWLWLTVLLTAGLVVAAHGG
jgi:hypothetical protein